MALHNTLLHFYLSTGNTGTGFSITDDGLLSVATALDAETTSFYSLEITATDRHSTQSLSGTAKVSVTVTGKLVENEVESKRQKLTTSNFVFFQVLLSTGSGLVALNYPLYRLVCQCNLSPRY